MNPASLAVEATKVAKGKESPSNLGLYIIVAFMADAVFERAKENPNMFENIFMPAGSEDLIFILAVFGGVLFPLIVSLVFKDNSKGAAAKFEGKYIGTLLIDMVATPTISLIIMSAIASRYFVDIDVTTYVLFLSVVMIIVAYFLLKMLNEGIKAVVDQLVGIKEDVQYAQDKLQPKQ